MTKRKNKEVDEMLLESDENSVDINLDSYEAQIIELMRTDDEEDIISPADTSCSIEFDNDAFCAVMTNLKNILTSLKEAMEQEAARKSAKNHVHATFGG